MVDYKKIKTIIKITLGTLAVGAALWVGVQQYQKLHSEKSFEKLPKAQQEIVIKLRENKTPEKTIQLNIDAYNELIRLTNLYNDDVGHIEKMDSIKVTNLDERVLRITDKYKYINVLNDLLRATREIKQKMVL